MQACALSFQEKPFLFINDPCNIMHLNLFGFHLQATVDIYITLCSSYYKRRSIAYFLTCYDGQRYIFVKHYFKNRLLTQKLSSNKIDTVNDELDLRLC